MTATPLEARVRHLPAQPDQPGVDIIDLSGEIDAFGESALNAAYARAEEDQPEAIVLNFAAAGYINSTGIALIVTLLRRARAAQRRLVAYGLSPHYAQIFEITRLSDFLGLFPDEASALASLGVIGVPSLSVPPDA